jgi:hypothetical protein
VAGSEWACRETFVAIVVANLPIIQPLIRRGASKLGLSGMFSRSTKMGRSHPLGSTDGNGDTYALTKHTALRTGDAVSMATASRSKSQSKHVLSSRPSNGRIDITIDQEVTIVHEQMDRKKSDADSDDKIEYHSAISANKGV